MSVWGDIYDRGATGADRKEDIGVFMEPDRIDANQLAKMLNTGIVHFQYKKKAPKGRPVDSGPLRDAWGTRKSTTITKIPHGGDCPPKRAGYSIYFDLEKQDWRAFMDGLLVGVWNKVYTDEEFFDKFPDGIPTETV
jgi:hypothetical protein